MRELLDEAARRLRTAGIESPRADTRILWEFAQTISLSGRADTTEIFNAFLSRRLAHEPVAYVTGTKEFWSLAFEVGPGVLIPRPETETLIEQMLLEFPDRDAPLDILDLGTGTGCLLIAALSEYKNARGTGIDASPQALDWARRNVARHRMKHRADLRIGTWIEPGAAKFDVILSNPPYIPSAEIASLAPDVARFEPRTALDGGADGLEAYRALTLRIGGLLKPEGHAFLEMGQGQSGAVTAIFVAQRLAVVRIAPDLAGIGRCAVVKHI